MSLLLVLLVLLLAACDAPETAPAEAAPDTAATADPSDVPVLEPAFFTARDTADNIDSPAVWHGPEDRHWLLATAKETDAVAVYDAVTGRELQRFGTEGTGVGQLDRPNGVAVIDSLMLVVERDNRRVQVVALPSLRPLGTFGGQQLRRPYGLTVFREEGAYHLYVTDNYETADEGVPADSLLGERVHRFRFTVAAGGLEAEHLGAFGETAGPGRLRVVESLMADAAQGRLLIAEEEEGRSHLKVYDLSGRFTGELVDSLYFPHQAEGIALYACPQGDGYWVATDQGDQVNTFHVFDRRSLDHLGAFRLAGTLNTDGIALTQRAFGPFERGAFYAVHDDGNVAAVGWRAVAAALDLRSDCPG